MLRCRPARSIPSDDLYARLELPTDARPEAIEIAWRALLRRHHPDVAGPQGLELAKRINVAHDWLSDPDLRDAIRPRARRARQLERVGDGPTGGIPAATIGRPAGPGPDSTPPA